MSESTCNKIILCFNNHCYSGCFEEELTRNAMNDVVHCAGLQSMLV